MSSELSGGGCQSEMIEDIPVKPAEANGSAPGEAQVNHPITTNDGPNDSSRPQDLVTLVEESFPPTTYGVRDDIDAPLPNSHVEHPYSERDSVSSTPHSHSSTTNGIHSDATYQTDPKLKDQSMPIAIVGIGCRFPGDATSPDKLWDLISQGKNAQSEFPKDRFNLDAFYHPSSERKGAVSPLPI